MSIVACSVCTTEWAATTRPFCPNCLLESWLAAPDLIADKHSPDRAGEAQDSYRSFVADEVIENLRAFLADAVDRGTWYFNSEYEKFNHVTRLPLEQKPGSGVRSGNTRPDRRLDDFVIADADFAPHIFVDDPNETRRKLATGIYRPLDACSRSKCDNLRRPGHSKCVLHGKPPLATKSRA